MADSTGNTFTFTADGNSPEFTMRGPIRLSLTGTFGGGTATLQAKVPQTTTFIDVVNGAFTSPTDKRIDWPKAAKTVVRVNVSGSTTPNLLAWLQQSEWVG